MKANKCLYISKTLRKEQYNLTEIDHLFRSLVLPNITYGLSIYGASESDLKIVQRFLDRCHKRNYISFLIRVHELLQKQDTKIFAADTHCGHANKKIPYLSAFSTLVENADTLEPVTADTTDTADT